MVERRLTHPLRSLLIAAAAVITLVVPASGSATAATATQGTKAKSATSARAARKAVTPLSGWVGDGATFPERALVLSGPLGLTASRIHVFENGVAVNPFTVTPTGQAGPGDFGEVLVLDQSPTMRGGPMAAAMNAVRSFAGRRRAEQELGLVTFDSQPNLILPLTDNPAAISSALGSVPWTGAGADVPAATQLALAQLATARVALGAIVVISDGVGLTQGGPTPASVQAAAAVAHVPIFTVGVQDKASTHASLQALAAASPGQFVPSSPAQLSSRLQAISSALSRGYVVRYRSRQARGKSVAVSVTADGVPGSLRANYRTPAPSRAPVARPVKRPSDSALPAFSLAARLSRLPSFATAAARPASAATGSSLLSSPTSIALVAALFGLLLGVAILLALYRPSKRAVLARVGSFIPTADSLVEGGFIRAPESTGKLRRLLERGTWWAPFVEDVEVGRSSHTPVALVKRAAAIGAVLAVLVTVGTGSVLLGVVPLLLWPIPLKMFITRGARKQRELFIDTLPGYLQDLASALRVGRSFASAMGVVAANADEPVRSELERAVTDEALGRPLDESLVAVGLRMRSNDVDQVALIAGLNRRSGSNVAEALDRVADGARDRADMRREVKALTGQAKMSSWVLTSLPPLLLVMVNIISPLYAHPLFHTTLGIVLMIASTLMVIAGWKVMKKITEIKA